VKSTGGNEMGPQILDYVNQKAEENELSSQQKNLEKKQELATVAWKKARVLAARNNITI